MEPRYSNDDPREALDRVRDALTDADDDLTEACAVLGEFIEDALATARFFKRIVAN